MLKWILSNLTLRMLLDGCGVVLILLGLGIFSWGIQER